MDIKNIHCLLIADHTIDQLGAILKNGDDAPAIKTSVAPFDQVQQVLMNGALSCWKQGADTAVVWTRPERSIDAFRQILQRERVTQQELLAQVDEFADLITRASERVEALFVPTWTMPAWWRGTGGLELKSRPGAIGAVRALLMMNARLAEKLENNSRVHLLDASRWMAGAGKNATNPKLWLMTKALYSLEVFKDSAADIKAILRGIAGLSKKLVVLDLDDTLWGGIVGENGWEGVALGGHDPIGESFADFQRALKALKNSGIILGIVSKNDEKTALSAIRENPEMVLKDSDFAGWRINWQDKATNIKDLVEELNLGLDSVVFIDDNPAERARVKETLPQITVPEWPADKMLYTQALHALRLFDRPGVTDEDLGRTEMYVAERQRTESKSSSGSMEDWLASLQLKVTYEPLGPGNIKRAAQLFNKTNQMNLTTRRMTEAELLAWGTQPNHAMYAYRVADRFGDYGLTGLASVEVNGGEATVTDFLLSCRVMGRGVEKGMLTTLLDFARKLGAKKTTAKYVETKRNKPCLDYFKDESGMPRNEAATEFWWTHDQDFPTPSHITLVEGDGNTPAPETEAAHA
ncbi:MAG: HAD-IIIC family phosphatase [Planctomycetes bacterium]|nr:HAD-IIIC family phosphatase [Planctomycetota bacterium]